MTFIDRVADRASSYSIIRAVLWVPAAVFWLLGAVVGLVWLVVSWSWAAIGVGFGDASRRGGN